MNYDSFCMAAAVEELRTGFLGAFVDQVYQPEPLVVALAFTGRGPRRFWLLSSDARWPRSHATALRRPNPETPPGFCMLLRKHLNGARLAAAEQVRFDRVLRLTFRRGEESRVLVHEVMGRHSNLILLDDGGTVLGAAKAVPPSQSRVRPVLPGQPYDDPPGARPDPRTLSRAELRALLAGAETPEAITRALSGWGTFPAREALGNVKCQMSDVKCSGAAEGVAEAVFSLMERVRGAEFAPTVFEDEAGRPKGTWAFPSRQEGWTRGHPAASLSLACDEYYGYLEAHAAEEALRKTVLGALERALRTARVQQSEAEASLEGLDRAETLKIKGELLAAQGSRVERGAAAVELTNWYDPEGAPLRVELDPELDARENAERFFHRYRRAMAAAEAALERLPELSARAEELAALTQEARAADEERLRGLHQRLKEQGLLREQGPGQEPGRKAAPEFPPGIRVRRVPVGGWEVLYGDNATSNDWLTTRHARPGDLWLHARAVNGAHVVVRGVTSLDRLPPEVLREAARIAAAHSDAKHSTIVPVDYTFRRHVRKPRGSAPGLVTYTGEKTLHVELR
jgi:predicted ribosome quality control (RQC) complex YloA/Tae2 family protein